MHNEVNGYYLELLGRARATILSRILDVPMTDKS